MRVTTKQTKKTVNSGILSDYYWHVIYYLPNYHSTGRETMLNPPLTSHRSQTQRPKSRHRPNAITTKRHHYHHAIERFALTRLPKVAKLTEKLQLHLAEHEP